MTNVVKESDITSLFSFATPSHIPREHEQESRKLYFTGLHSYSVSDTIFARMGTTTQGEGARAGGTTNRFHPQGKATHAASILITYTTPALGRSFIDRAGWFAEQVSGLENGPFSRHIGSRRREREGRRPEARSALEMMGKEELNMISA